MLILLGAQVAGAALVLLCVWVWNGHRERGYRTELQTGTIGLIEPSGVDEGVEIVMVQIGPNVVQFEFADEVHFNQGDEVELRVKTDPDGRIKSAEIVRALEEK